MSQPMKDLAASTVACKSLATILAQTLLNFLSARDSNLFLFDNSPTRQLKYLAYYPRITYIFNSKNIGFAPGHNISLRKIIHESKNNWQLSGSANVPSTGPSFIPCLLSKKRRPEVPLATNLNLV